MPSGRLVLRAWSLPWPRNFFCRVLATTTCQRCSGLDSLPRSAPPTYGPSRTSPPRPSSSPPQTVSKRDLEAPGSSPRDPLLGGGVWIEGPGGSEIEFRDNLRGVKEGRGGEGSERVRMSEVHFVAVGLVRVPVLCYLVTSFERSAAKQIVGCTALSRAIRRRLVRVLNT